MSDIFTQLYQNINKFKYPNQMYIENDDIILFEKSLSRAIINPTIFLSVTIIFSRMRPRLLRNLKMFFYKHKPESVKKKLISEIDEKFSEISKLSKSEKIYSKILNFKKEKITENEKNQLHESIMKEFDYSESHITNPSLGSLKINSSRKVTSRKYNQTEEIMNIPRKEPTFREEFFTFGKGYRAKASKLLFFKRFLNNNIDRENFNNKSLAFLLNTKLVYLPFIIFSCLTLFDFGYTTFGLYLKYQPLIDTHLEYNNKTKI